MYLKTTELRTGLHTMTNCVKLSNKLLLCTAHYMNTSKSTALLNEYRIVSPFSQD